MKKPAPTKNAIFFLLLAFIILLLFFGYKKSKDYSKLTAVFIEEKKQMQNELDEIIEDYKDLKIQKKGLSNRLIREMNKIIALRDSIEALQETNYDLILKYRRRINTLERENRDLFVRVDSLSVLNTYLKNNNLEISEKLANSQNQNEQLQQQQQQLESKIQQAGIIKISPAQTIVMKERSSGKLTTTFRANRADAFKTMFKLLENKLSKKGQKNIYIQITDPNKNVIASKGKTKLKNGNSITFSEKLSINYRNKPMDILSLVLVNRQDMHKGIYTIKVYVDGYYSGITNVNLR